MALPEPEHDSYNWQLGGTFEVIHSHVNQSTDERTISVLDRGEARTLPAATVHELIDGGALVPA